MRSHVARVDKDYTWSSRDPDGMAMMAEERVGLESRESRVLHHSTHAGIGKLSLNDDDVSIVYSVV